MGSLIPTLEQIENMTRELRDARYMYWLEYDLLSPHWWVLLAAAFLPWIIWWKLVDKRRFVPIVLIGLLWLGVGIVLDEFGTALMLWAYPHKLLPIVPPLLPADMTIFPIMFMLSYQWAPRGRLFLLGSIINSAIIAFLVEKVFDHFGLYVEYHWNEYLSFLAFVALSCLVRWAAERITDIQKSRM